MNQRDPTHFPSDSHLCTLPLFSSTSLELTSPHPEPTLILLIRYCFPPPRRAKKSRTEFALDKGPG